MTARGLLDTSVFIAAESGRELDADALPDESYVCVVTVAELEAGVLAATDTAVRHRRLLTARTVSGVQALPIDTSAASHWARLRVLLHEAGRRVNINDLWIASVAAAHDLPVITQDDDFQVLAEMGLVEVVRV